MSRVLDDGLIYQVLSVTGILTVQRSFSPSSLSRLHFRKNFAIFPIAVSMILACKLPGEELER